MTTIKTVFFGSTSDSVLVLTKLYETRNPALPAGRSKLETRIAAVVTQPPRPVGRKQVLTPTPVESWAKDHDSTVLTFPSDPTSPWLYANEQQVIDTVSSLKANLLISACYGQKIPWSYIQSVKYGGLNVHPSLLPRWRGADPVPWAILTGDHQTGVSVVTLSKEFDEGVVMAQKKIPITDRDTSDTLRTQLFTLGAQLLIENLNTYIENPRRYVPRPSQQHNQGQASIVASSPYARRLSRDDGFIPWELIQSAIDGKGSTTIQQFNNITIVKDYMNFNKEWKKEKSLGTVLERFHRALSPWPGIWTEIEIRDKQKERRKIKKRLKILSLHLSPVTYRLSLGTVQLEGKTPVPFSQFSSVYLPVFSR